MSASPGAGPILQLTRERARWLDAGEGVTRLRDELRRQHCVRLPALLEPELLKQIQLEIQRAEFNDFAHGSVARELCMERNSCVGLLHFLVNDPDVYRLIEDVSGCRPVRCFFGRVYRHVPDGAHFHLWHSDLSQGRQLGMSINLSPEVYEGGLFEIRDLATKKPFASIANVGFGDAILFRLAETLEHRVTRLRGSVPKTAFAGWFRPTPDYRAALRDDPYLAERDTA